MLLWTPISTKRRNESSAKRYSAIPKRPKNAQAKSVVRKFPQASGLRVPHIPPNIGRPMTRTEHSARAPLSRDVTVLSDRGSDVGKMNVQLIANEENQDRTQSGKDEAGGGIAFVFGARKHVGNGAADDRSDDAKHNRPEERYMHVHHRFCDNPRD